MVYSNWDYWVFGLCPSFGILMDTGRVTKSKIAVIVNQDSALFFFHQFCNIEVFYAERKLNLRPTQNRCIFLVGCSQLVTITYL
jgi:hypothetical protein